MVSDKPLPGFVNGLSKSQRTRKKRRKNNFSFALISFLTIILGILMAVSSYSAERSSDVSIAGQQQPYVVYGYVYYPNGTVAQNVPVNITNARTGNWTINYTNENGYYQVDLANMDGGYADGDLIYVNVTVDKYWGSNSTVVNTSATSAVEVDVHLQETTPELNSILFLVDIMIIIMLLKKEVIL